MEGWRVVFDRLVFRVDAIQRMYERGISEKEINSIIRTGETIEDYPSDFRNESRGDRPHFDVLRIVKTCKLRR
jgi:hypothetical protein